MHPVGGKCHEERRGKGAACLLQNIPHVTVRPCDGWGRRRNRSSRTIKERFSAPLTSLRRFFRLKLKRLAQGLQPWATGMNRRLGHYDDHELGGPLEILAEVDGNSVRTCGAGSAVVL